jgi:uncharacterized protein (DUF488 family)
MSRESRNEPVVFTIGHSTRSIEELIALLTRNGVRQLVDVRRFPGSRRHPHFNREALAPSLAEAGILYRHAPELGGRRGAPDPASPNTGWRNASFRAYADHLGTAEFSRALDTVIEDAKRGPAAIMCAEAVPWRCHRQLISAALVARGHPVLHILSEAEPRPHELNGMARTDGRGGVTYPGATPEQRELFGES